MNDSYFERVAKNVGLLSDAFYSIRDLRKVVRLGGEISTDDLFESLDKVFCAVYFMFGTLSALEEKLVHEIQENK